MQAKIEQIYKKFDMARCFVRPSGTEDIVRIYAEAKTHEDIAQIVAAVSEVVTDHPIINQ